jgi:hypothetical protein
LVFGCTLVGAVGIVAWSLQARGVDAGWGGSGPTGSTVGVAAGTTTTTVSGSETSTTTPPAAAGELRSRLAGVWEGEAVQRSNQTSWTISMALQPARKQGTAGIIAYPSLACGGELTLVAASASETRLREHITFGSCVDDGSIVVRVAGGGRLSWRWYTPNGDLDAETTLTPVVRSTNRIGVVPARLGGLWEGEGYQFSTQQRWTISMALQPGRSRRIAGTIAYPSLACGGELTLLTASRSEVRVREDITYGNCVDNGSIVVRPAAGGRLDWKYYLPDGGRQDAESTVQRLR